MHDGQTGTTILKNNLSISPREMANKYLAGIQETKNGQTARYCRIVKSATGTTEMAGIHKERPRKTFPGRKWKIHISFFLNAQHMHVSVYRFFT